MTEKELKELKAKIEELREELRELSEEELQKVIGGSDHGHGAAATSEPKVEQFNSTYRVVSVLPIQHQDW